MDERVEEAEVFCDGVGGGGVGGVLCPGEEGARSGDVFGDGLLGQYVFSSCEGFLDVIWLRGNWESGRY